MKLVGGVIVTYSWQLPLRAPSSYQWSSPSMALLPQAGEKQPAPVRVVFSQGSSMQPFPGSYVCHLQAAQSSQPGRPEMVWCPLPCPSSTRASLASFLASKSVLEHTPKETLHSPDWLQM